MFLKNSCNVICAGYMYIYNGVPGCIFDGIMLSTDLFFTVLCLYVANFLRGARREICGYFNVQIW